MASIIVIFFILILIPIRLARWLAIIQQKEYRLDRLLIFFKSVAGLKESLTLINIPTKLTLTQIKRPKITSRIFLLFSIFNGLFLLLTILFYPAYLNSFRSNFNLAGSSSMTAATYLALIYVLIPVLLIISILPTAIIAEVVTRMALKKAQVKLSKNPPQIIGITGSYGKTSTKLLLAHIFSSKFSVFITPKSHNTRYSIAQSILSTYSNQELAILEYAAYTKGEIKNLARYFAPNLAVITGITAQHLGLFGSLSNIIKAKYELIKALPKDGLIFANNEDLNVQKMLRQSTHPIIVYTGPKAKLRISHAQLSPTGKLQFTWENTVIKTNLIGTQYLSTVKAAITIAMHLGVKKSQIITSLQSFKPTSNFISSYQTKNGALVIDDGGATNPKGFQAAITLAEQLDKKTKILITGGILDLGQQSGQIHTRLAKTSQKTFQQVLYVGQDGVEEFKQIFGDNCFTSLESIHHVLHTLDNQSLLLIEGRVHPDILKSIDLLRNKR